MLEYMAADQATKCDQNIGWDGHKVNLLLQLQVTTLEFINILSTYGQYITEINEIWVGDEHAFIQQLYHSARASCLLLKMFRHKNTMYFNIWFGNFGAVEQCKRNPQRTALQLTQIWYIIRVKIKYVISDNI